MKRTRKNPRKNSFVRPCALHRCEPIEPRRLLAGDPVIVIAESVSLTTLPEVTAETVAPWLYNNPDEFEWLETGVWNTEDEDDNGYPDDAYGWNFAANSGAGSPNVFENGSHGASVMKFAIWALEGAGENAERVRIMIVNGTGDQITDYVIAQKDDGVNIVSVSASASGGAPFSRCNAKDLGEEDILLFAGSSVGALNMDTVWGSANNGAFYHATPRRGIQYPAVETILSAAVAATGTDYGINSFHFASSLGPVQSYVQPVASVYAGAAAQEYQDAHSGNAPTALQIKRAMMSGVDYPTGIDSLAGRTITHDYDGSARQGGGLLELSDTVAGSLGIIESINQTSPEITGVEMSQASSSTGTLGTTVSFNLDSDVEPSNWTISWGDNSLVDRSGVEVVDGGVTTRSHTFPFFENAVHYYHPTIYAMSDTDQVYLQASQMEPVEITTPFAPTTGADHYVLDRDSNGKTRLTFGSFSHSFATSSSPSNELPDLILTLGADDTLLIDFTNGDMLANTTLKVHGTGSAGGVSVLGGAGADVMTRTSIAESEEESFTVENSSFNSAFHVDSGLKVTLDGAGGNDTLSSDRNSPTTLVGGANDDLAVVTGSREDETFTISSAGVAVTSVFGSITIAISGVEAMSVSGGSQIDDDLFIVPADLGLPVTVNGGDGTDTLTFNGTSSPDTIALAASTVTSGSTVVTTTNTESRIINGGSGNDTVTSASNIGNAVTINGDANTDSVVVNGTSSADSITVATNTVTSGSTVLTTATIESRIINGGNGADTINASTSSAAVAINGEADNDSLTGGSGNDSLVGGAGSDVITGNAGNDSIPSTSDDSADTINSGSGADTVYGGPGADSITGGPSSFDNGDTIYGEDGGDTIYGGDESDFGGGDAIYGGGGNDVIDAQGGDDYIEDGAGDDLIYGGPGNDTIIANGGGGGGTDTLNGDGGNDYFQTLDGVMDVIDGGSGYDELDQLGLFDEGEDETCTEIELIGA